MRARTVYGLHRWIAICCGVVLLSQLISGAVIVLPHFGGIGAAASPPLPDYRASTLSPAGALAAMERQGTDDPPVSRVTQMRLQAVLGRLLYEVHIEGVGTRLIDAASGETVEITPRMAVEIAHGVMASALPVRQVERLERHDYRWRHGVLPVYRIAFGDAAASALYVNAETGAVVGRGNRWDRIRTVITGLHVFEPVVLLFGSGRIRNASILLFAGALLAVVLTGYVLALSRAWRRRGSPRRLGVTQRFPDPSG